ISIARMHSPLKYAPKAHSTVKVSIILFFCPSANVQSSATRNQPARTAPQSGTGSAIPRWLQRFVGHHVVNHSKLSSKSAPENAIRRERPQSPTGLVRFYDSAG